MAFILFKNNFFVLNFIRIRIRIPEKKKTGAMLSNVKISKHL